MTETLLTQRETGLLMSRAQADSFSDWFSRFHNTLRYIGHRILGDCRMVERAVQNCWFRASRNPPEFESEGAFRSWVVRLLISEALFILHQNRTAASEPYLHFEKK